MPAYAQTPKRIRAEAIAMVESGKSRREVARQLGVTDMTVRAWIEKADEQLPHEEGTARELATQRREEIQLEILSGLQACVLKGIDQILAKLDKCTANQAVGVVKLCSEQLALQQGQPTAIQGHMHSASSGLQQAMDQLAERRADSIDTTAQEVPDEAAAA